MTHLLKKKPRFYRLSVQRYSQNKLFWDILYFTVFNILGSGQLLAGHLLAGQLRADSCSYGHLLALIAIASKCPYEQLSARNCPASKCPASNCPRPAEIPLVTVRMQGGKSGILQLRFPGSL